MDHKASQPPIPSHPLRWFPEFLDLGRKRLRAQARLLALSLLVGVLSGLGAIVFYAASHNLAHYALGIVAGYHAQEPRGEQPNPVAGPVVDVATAPAPQFPWLLLVVPVVGGLLSGILVYTLAPEAEGHGTDAAIAAYHFRQGYIRPMVPLVKIVASALTLGSGGSGGREGPIAQVGAGFGSWFGRVLRLRPVECRVLMAAGMGAGVAAIFRAPLAGALFAAEVLYSSPDFEPTVIIPAGLASVLAYCTFGLAFGWRPLFDLTPKEVSILSFNSPWQLIHYTLLALFVAVLAMLYTRSFYGLTYLFHRLPLRRHFKPAVGAFLTGLVGVTLYLTFGQERVLAVLSFGYGALQEAMTVPVGDGPGLSMAAVLLAIALGKILTTGLTIGSGGSGGVFGPSMVIGGCGAGALGIVLGQVLPGAPLPAAFVIVGMAGFFAAAAKTPFSTLLMVSELTGNYNLLLPALWVCALAFLLSDEQSIYSSQLTSRSRSPAHQGAFVRDVLAGLRVERFLTTVGQVAVLHPEDTLASVVKRLGATPYQMMPVVEGEGRLVGVVNIEEVHLAGQSPHLSRLAVAADLMRTDVTPLQPEDGLDRALELFVESDLLALPVVDDWPGGRMVGIVRRSEIAGAYMQQMRGPGAENSDGALAP